jgi:CBS-domain-containing membrane protein
MNVFEMRRMGMNVFEVMTRSVFSCRLTDSLATAAAIMWDHDVGCLPVTTDGGTAVGVITDRDICMAAFTRATRLEEIEVASVISRELHACSPEQSVAEVEEIMRLEQIRRTPVIDESGRLLGMLSLGDLAREAMQQKRLMEGPLLAEEITTTLAAVSSPRAVPKAA